MRNLSYYYKDNDSLYSAPPAGFYYSSRSGNPSGAPSPSHSHVSHRSHADMTQHRNRRSVDPPIDEVTPSYNVEHLATFAVGRQFGLTFPADGIRKLKQMEKNSAIWAQPLILRFRANVVTVEDENGDLVEQFPLELIEQPTAHVSNDPRDTYNNILLFIVKEDGRNKRNTTPTEMHIFQCNRVPATEVADDLQAFLRGQSRKVRSGRRSGGDYMQQQQPFPTANAMPQYPPDDASISSDSSELFERDVNTLNRCFDDIERFVARIQSAAFAQRELEQQAHRYRTAQRRDKRQPNPDPTGILHMRAQLPMENEFIDILRKFKLSFNLLAKLKSHIHEPNAPELLHFLFTPLQVILESCHWGLGRNIAPQIVAPLLSLEARELMQNCLTSKESDVWMSLGETWRTPPEDWSGPLPAPYRPVFLDGFAPYGLPEQSRPSYPAPIHRGESAPPTQFRQPSRDSRDTRDNRDRSVDTLNLDRLSLERERMEFERAKMLERERRLLEEERKLRDERARVEAERNLLKQETSSIASSRAPKPNYDVTPSQQPSPAPARPSFPAPARAPYPAARPILPDIDAQSPRQRAFVDDVVNRGAKLVVATFDRVAQNAKELTVSRGEYLEVLDDTKNWWECRNVHQRVGYVPHTILSMVPVESADSGREIYGEPMPIRRGPTMNGHVSQHSPKQAPIVSDAGVQANIHQVQHVPPPPPVALQQPAQYAAVPQQQQYQVPMQQYQQAPPPPPPVIPPPAPTPSMLDMLRQQQLRKVEQPREPEVREAVAKPSILVTTRTNTEQQLVNELASTVGKKKGEILRGKKDPVTVQINERSSAQDVALWLEEKGFSYRVLELFDGQDGAALFSLNKNHLIQACGKDEGSRLYSQILVQKKRSNYHTHSNAELNAILNFRKTHVEVTNTAPAEEPNLPVAS